MDEEYWLLQSNKAIRTFIGQELQKRDRKYEKKRPDFVCAVGENKLIILEIKRPSHKLTVEDLNQLELYTVIAEDYRSKDYGTVEGYLIGNKKPAELEKYLKKRRGIKVRTYSDLINTVKFKYREYLKRLQERGLEIPHQLA